MNAVEKNGQPSMEEILASIRRIIAEEPNGPSPVIDLKARSKPVLITSLIDEQPDFELPAIFRPNAQNPEKHTPLFGRLTDAIRNASGVAAEARSTKGVELTTDENQGAPQQRLNGNSNGHGYAPAPAAAEVVALMPEPALSQLNLARDEAMASHPYAHQHLEAPLASHQNGFNHAPAETAQVSEPASLTGAVSEWWSGTTQQAPVSATSSNETVKREMVPFKDMRMARMGGMSSVPAPSAAASPSPEPPPADVVAAPQYRPAPAPYPHMDVPSVFQSEPPAYERPVAPAPPPVLEAVHIAASPYPDPIPSIPADVHYAKVTPLPQQATPASGVEDATADLLRPMLRQWLAENMPRMVEKALHIEVAESVKLGKKPGSV